jgi:hypothetical protein
VFEEWGKMYFCLFLLLSFAVISASQIRDKKSNERLFIGSVFRGDTK